MQLYFLYVDKVLHLLGGIMLCSVVYHFIGTMHISRRKKYLVTFSLSIAVILGYEFYEYFSDVIFNTRMQGVYRIVENELVIVIGSVIDTASDIVIGLTGVIVYLVVKVRR